MFFDNHDRDDVAKDRLLYVKEKLRDDTTCKRTLEDATEENIKL